MEKLEEKGALRLLVKLLESGRAVKVTDLKEHFKEIKIERICDILESLSKIGLVQEKKEDEIPDNRIARLTDFGVQVAEKLKYIKELFGD